MTNNAGTNGGRGTAKHMRETTQRVAERQKRVTRDGRFSLHAKRGPSRIRRKRGEATHKFADKRRCVQKRVSCSRGGRRKVYIRGVGIQQVVKEEKTVEIEAAVKVVRQK